MRNLTIVVMLLLLSACKHFTPYEADFSCPETFGGKCISTTTAYEESINGDPQDPLNETSKASDTSESSESSNESDKDIADAIEKAAEPDSTEVTYFNALVKKMTSILKEPKTPMIKPPKVIRVLVLPYEGSGSELYMPRYIYLIVDKAQWVLENQLTGKKRHLRSQQPFPRDLKD